MQLGESALKEDDTVVVATEAGKRGGSAVTGRISSRPQTPTERFQFDSVASVSDSAAGSRESYRIERNYTAEGVPVTVIDTVTLFTGDQFFLWNTVYENTESTSITLDHPGANIHDGHHLSEAVHLAGRSDDESDYRFHLPGQGTRQFTDTGKWDTFPGTAYGTVFDDTAAVTHGLIDGATEPHMWIKETGHLDYLMQPVQLNSGQSISYLSMYGIHDGGTTAPENGKDLYQAATSRTTEL